jgi:hypothetical protein
MATEAMEAAKPRRSTLEFADPSDGESEEMSRPGQEKCTIGI